MLGEVNFPIAALVHVNFGMEGLFHFVAEGVEGQLVPIFELVVELFSFRRREVENAMTDGRLKREACVSGVGSGLG